MSVLKSFIYRAEFKRARKTMSGEEADDRLEAAEQRVCHKSGRHSPLTSSHVDGHLLLERIWPK